MKKYSVGLERDNGKIYYYIQDDTTLDMVIPASKYLMHKIRSNRSPNTVRRAAYAICYYMEYLAEEKMEFQTVYGMAFEQQNDHFVSFLYWLKEGKHKEERFKKIPDNGTCNAYLKDVFRFYLFMETQGIQKGSLKVLSYGTFTAVNAVGIKKKMNFRAFGGYLRAEERNVRAAKKQEIVTILRACTNCRDQLLILLLSETGFRIGELLGIRYTKDVDYSNQTFRVWFRDDNENGARAKNGEERRAKVSKETFSFLMHYLTEYRDLLQRQDYLFINIAGETAGKPLRVRSVYAMLERMEKKTQIRITPHMLRRYFAMARWDNGWQLELLSVALGHRHMDTTVKYLNAIDERLMQASREFYNQHTDDYGIKELL